MFYGNFVINVSIADKHQKYSTNNVEVKYAVKILEVLKMPTSQSQSEYEMFSQFKYTEVSLQLGGKGYGEVIMRNLFQV